MPAFAPAQRPMNGNLQLPSPANKQLRQLTSAPQLPMPFNQSPWSTQPVPGGGFMQPPWQMGQRMQRLPRPLRRGGVAQQPQSLSPYPPGFLDELLMQHAGVGRQRAPMLNPRNDFFGQSPWALY